MEFCRTALDVTTLEDQIEYIVITETGKRLISFGRQTLLKE